MQTERADVRLPEGWTLRNGRREPPNGFDDPDCQNCQKVMFENEFRACQACRFCQGVIVNDLTHGRTPLGTYFAIYNNYARFLNCEPALTRLTPVLDKGTE